MYVNVYVSRRKDAHKQTTKGLNECNVQRSEVRSGPVIVREIEAAGVTDARASERSVRFRQRARLSPVEWQYKAT